MPLLPLLLPLRAKRQPRRCCAHHWRCRRATHRAGQLRRLIQLHHVSLTIELVSQAMGRCLAVKLRW
jgi:hypothetical protein